MMDELCYLNVSSSEEIHIMLTNGMFLVSLYINP